MSNNVELTSNRDKVSKEVDKAFKKSARMIGGSLAGHAAEAAPVDTGLLRNSITFALGGEAPQITEYAADKPGKDGTVGKGSYTGQAAPDDEHQVTVYVGTNVEHGIYQELGTVKMDARPFLRPAFEDNQDEIEQIIEMNLKDL